MDDYPYLLTVYGAATALGVSPCAVKVLADCEVLDIVADSPLGPLFMLDDVIRAIETTPWVSRVMVTSELLH